MKIPAVVNYAPEKGSVEVREIEKPSIGEEDVLLEVANVGVCGSDLHQWTSSHSWPVNYPIVLGHEFGGRVAEIGSRVVGWKEGDRVVSETAAVIDPNNCMTRLPISATLPQRVWLRRQRSNDPVRQGARPVPASRAGSPLL